MTRFLTRLDIAIHVLVCTVWRRPADAWEPAIFSRQMRRLTKDRLAWEYRPMTSAERENSEWNSAIR